ncbi:Protein cms1 [Entomophthora muscae]|uniref:Protein cms1 n=1 Tax=Entomophthora muscae TaxID=34485 RepID=A0ACC2T934_9FUNG|nr:Protein cms1 [Entomophthora muscae]
MKVTGENIYAHAADSLEDDFDIAPVSASDPEDAEESDDSEQVQAAPVKRKDPVSVSKPKKKVKFHGNADLSSMAPIEICDFFWAKLRNTFPDSSELELEPAKLREDSCFDNSSFEMAHTIADFPAFVRATVSSSESLSQRSGCNGAPIVLVITPSAIRAASVARAIKDACGELKVAKLFAKHLKVEEQTTFLKSSDITLGAGSPNRITKLVELGSLKLDRLQVVVIDLFKDPKHRTLFDVPECSKDFFHFYRSCILPLNSNVKLAFF